MKLIALYKAFTGGEWFEASLESAARHTDGAVVVFSRRPWLTSLPVENDCERPLARFMARHPAYRIEVARGDFRDQGDHRRGIARMREVVGLDPQMTEAFAELGGMLYFLSDFERALSAYDLALQQRPTMRAALQGSAKVYRQLADYASAARHLRTILRYNPDDAETWMNLGDLGIFQGDEVLARECYLRATQIDPEAKAIIEQARQRLALMAEVSRTYQGKR